jgi:hypothetical protein
VYPVEIVGGVKIVAEVSVDKQIVEPHTAY